MAPSLSNFSAKSRSWRHKPARIGRTVGNTGTVLAWPLLLGSVLTLLASAGVVAVLAGGRHHGRRRAVLLVLAGLAPIPPSTLVPLYWPSRRFTNAVPFINIFDQASGPVAPLNLLANVALFVPLGVVVALVIGDDHLGRSLLWRAAAAGLVVSVLVEVIQLAFPMGRVADVDDVLVNTTGAVVGTVLAHRWQHRQAAITASG